MSRISTYSGGTGDWLNGFTQSELEKQTTRKVQADYMSRLREHIEQQQSAGKYSSVENAIDDFSTRLNLSQLERESLHRVVKLASFFDDKAIEKDIKNGAPQSVKPGVKPNKITNKQPVRTDLSQNSTPDLGNNNPGAPTAKSSIEKFLKFSQTFPFQIFDKNKCTLDSPANGPISFSRHEDVKFAIKWKSQVSKLLDKDIILGFIKKHLDIEPGFVTSKARVALLGWINGTETGPKKIGDTEESEPAQPETQKPEEVKPSEVPPVVDTKTAPAEQAKDKSILPPPAVDEDELESFDDPLLAAALKQVDGISAMPLPSQSGVTRKFDITELGITTSDGTKNVNTLKGISSTDNTYDGGMTSDRYKRLVRLFTTSENFSETHQKLSKEAEAFSGQIENLQQRRTLTDVCYIALNAAKQIEGLRVEIADFEKRIDNLPPENEQTPEQKQEATKLAYSLKMAQQKLHKQENYLKAGLPELSERFGFAPTVANAIKAVATDAIEKQLREQNEESRQYSEALHKSYAETSVALQAVEYQTQGAAVLKLLVEAGPKILTPTEQYEQEIDRALDRKRNRLLPTDRSGNPIPPGQLTPYQKQQWEEVCAQSNLSESDISTYKQLLKTVPGPNRISQDGLQQVYNEALKSETDVIKRFSNQKCLNGVEYVFAPYSKTKYRGYLPDEELIRFQTVLDTGMTEKQLLKEHGDQASMIFLSRREAAINLAEKLYLESMSELRTLQKNAASTKDTEQKAYFNNRLMKLQEQISDKLVNTYTPSKHKSPDNLGPYFLLPLVEAKAIKVPPYLLLPIIYQDILNINASTQSHTSHADQIEHIKNILHTKGFAAQSYDATLAEYFDEMVDTEFDRVDNDLETALKTTAFNIRKHTEDLQDLVQQLEKVIAAADNPYGHESTEAKQLQSKYDAVEQTLDNNQKTYDRGIALQTANKLFNRKRPNVATSLAHKTKITPKMLLSQARLTANLEGFEFEGFVGPKAVARNVLERVFIRQLRQEPIDKDLAQDEDEIPEEDTVDERRIQLIRDTFPLTDDGKLHVSAEDIVKRIQQLGADGIITGFAYPILSIPPQNVSDAYTVIAAIGASYTPAKDVTFDSKCTVLQVPVAGRNYVVWSGTVEQVADQVTEAQTNGIDCQLPDNYDAFDEVAAEHASEVEGKNEQELSFTLEEVDLTPSEFRDIFSKAMMSVFRYKDRYNIIPKVVKGRSKARVSKIPGLMGDPNIAMVGRKGGIYKGRREAYDKDEKKRSDRDEPKARSQREKVEKNRQNQHDASVEYGKTVKDNAIKKTLTKRKLQLGNYEQLFLKVKASLTAKKLGTNPLPRPLETYFNDIFANALNPKKNASSDTKALARTLKVIRTLIRQSAAAADPKVDPNRYDDPEASGKKIDALSLLSYILKESIKQQKANLDSTSNLGFSNKVIELICPLEHAHPYKVTFTKKAPSDVKKGDVDPNDTSSTGLDEHHQGFVNALFGDTDYNKLKLHSVHNYLANQTDGFYVVVGARPYCKDCAHRFSPIDLHEALKSACETTGSGKRRQIANSFLTGMGEEQAKQSYFKLNEILDKLSKGSGAFSREQLGLDTPVTDEELPLLTFAKQGDSNSYQAFTSVFASDPSLEQPDPEALSEVYGAGPIESQDPKEKLLHPAVQSKDRPQPFRVWQNQLRTVCSKWLTQLIQDFDYADRSAYVNVSDAKRTRERAHREIIGTPISGSNTAVLVGYTAEGAKIIHSASDEGQISAWEKVVARIKNKEGVRHDASQATFQDTHQLLPVLYSALDPNAPMSELGALFKRYQSNTTDTIISTMFPHKSDLSGVSKTLFKLPFSKLYDAYQQAVGAAPEAVEEVSNATLISLKRKALQALYDTYGAPDSPKYRLFENAGSHSEYAIALFNDYLENDAKRQVANLIETGLQSVKNAASNPSFSTHESRNPLFNTDGLYDIENSTRDRLQHLHTVNQQTMQDSWKWIKGSTVRIKVNFNERSDGGPSKKQIKKREMLQLRQQMLDIASTKIVTKEDADSGIKVSAIQAAYDNFYKFLLSTIKTSKAKTVDENDISLMGRTRIEILNNILQPPGYLGYKDVLDDQRKSIEQLRFKNPKLSDKQIHAEEARVYEEHANQVAKNCTNFINQVLGHSNTPSSIRALIAENKDLQLAEQEAKDLLVARYRKYYKEAYDVGRALGATFAKNKPTDPDNTIFYKVLSVQPTKFNEVNTTKLGEYETQLPTFTRDLQGRAQALAAKLPSSPADTMSAGTEESRGLSKPGEEAKSKQTIKQQMQALANTLDPERIDIVELKHIRDIIVSPGTAPWSVRLFLREVDKLIKAIEDRESSIKTELKDSDVLKTITQCENYLIEAIRDNDEEAVKQLTARYKEEINGTNPDEQGGGGFVEAMLSRLFKGQGGSINFKLESVLHEGENIYVEDQDKRLKRIKVPQDQIGSKTLRLPADFAMSLANSNAFNVCDANALYAFLGQFFDIAYVAESAPLKSTK